MKLTTVTASSIRRVLNAGLITPSGKVTALLPAIIFMTILSASAQNDNVVVNLSVSPMSVSEGAGATSVTVTAST